jgi:cytochrome oxidase Cu insertion factor (SCO1/SenC/PrrC family)
MSSKVKRGFALKAGAILMLCQLPTFYAQAGSPPQEGNQYTQHKHQREAGSRQATGQSRMTIPDLELYDQDGKKIHFYSDLIKGKVVAINFIFTSCTYICPMQGSSFARLQNALGERLGKDIYLISISSDPVTDTPERLKAWGGKFGAKAGWVFVTGKKDNIDQLLRVMTGDDSGQKEHSPIMLLLNDDNGLWVRAYGLAEPERVLHDLKGLRTETR